MYRVEIDKNAAKEFKKIPGSDQIKILKKLERLGENPRQIGCEPLRGKLSEYFRIRFGKYRIVYEIFDDQLLVVVVKIAGRGNVYKNK